MVVQDSQECLFFQESQDPNPDTASLEKIFEKIEELQKQSKKDEGTSSRKKKKIKKKKNDEGLKEQIREAVNQAFETILKKSHEEEKEIAECPDQKEKDEDSNSRLSDEDEDPHEEGYNNSDSGMSFSSVARHNLST